MDTDYIIEHSRLLYNSIVVSIIITVSIIRLHYVDGKFENE